MIYHLIYDMEAICRRVVQDQLKNSGLKFTLLNRSELQIDQQIPEFSFDKLNKIFHGFGVQIAADPEDLIVLKIKDAIRELIEKGENITVDKNSCYLSKALNINYRYLSRVFSALTFTTIENYIILQKIEKAKEIIAADVLTFTEIAWRLNYSSVGHFSMQFKNTTGFTPSRFRRIINQRRNLV